MQFHYITIFPKIFDSYLNESILRIAKEKKKIKTVIWNLRDFTFDRHNTVDDKPYGGGPGMLFKVEPFYLALKKIRRNLKGKKIKVILLDPAGKKFNQTMAHNYAKLDAVVFLCGRYEGFDDRIKKLVDERVSVGDYVLSGGELPALIITEAVTRLLPGVLHDETSTHEETFGESDDYVEYPQYTRPEVFTAGKAKWRVPKVLLSGDHAKIKDWRKKNRKK